MALNPNLDEGVVVEADHRATAIVQGAHELVQPLRRRVMHDRTETIASRSLAKMAMLAAFSASERCGCSSARSESQASKLKALLNGPRGTLGSLTRPAYSIAFVPSTSVSGMYWLIAAENPAPRTTTSFDITCHDRSGKVLRGGSR